MPEQQLMWDGRSPSRHDPTVHRAPDADDWKMITQQVQTCQVAAYQAAYFVAGQALLAGQPFIWHDDKVWPAYNEAMGFVTIDVEINGKASCVTSGQITRED